MTSRISNTGNEFLPVMIFHKNSAEKVHEKYFENNLFCDLLVQQN